MHWIIQFIFQHKNFSSFLVMVLISLWLLSVDTVSEQKIARGLTLSVFFPFQFTINQLSYVKNLFSENRKLKEEVTILRTNLSLMQESVSENERLRQLIGFKNQFSFDMVPAYAVVREPSYLFRTIVINVGKNDGIGLYMPVVNKEGALGKVIQVFPRISLVQLLRDPSERISVMAKRNKEVGILSTINSSDFFIQYRKDTDLQKGDTIITSGFGGIYPAGIAVGVVTKIKNTNDPLFKDVYVDLFVKFERVEEVFVMRLSTQWSAFRNELDSITVDTPK
ncbi:MAG: rod shape-determining protein MreC [Chitinivibrionales bacterium]|nr:rod shape-determining protein MreC [Chitinivibrionales bacterium]